MAESHLDTPILIGGCGSSGTTLLRALLDKHPEVVCDDEVSFFNKREIYGDYDRFRRMLPAWYESGVACSGYWSQTDFFFRPDAVGITRDLAVEWSRRAADMRGYVQELKRHFLKKSGKRIFAEKTPTNVYCFRDFAQLFPESPIVHVIRDGRDVVCSLMKRGYSLWECGSRWVYDVSAGMSCRDLPRYMELRYEDLARDPEGVLRRLCRHLGVPFSHAMLERDGERTFRHPSWSSDAYSSPINTKSIGRYKKDLSEEQLALFYRTCLSRRYAQRFRLERMPACELLRELGYEAPGRDALPPLPLRKYGAPLGDWTRKSRRSMRRGRGPRPFYTSITLCR
jgi:hypothetical protein